MVVPSKSTNGLAGILTRNKRGKSISGFKFFSIFRIIDCIKRSRHIAIIGQQQALALRIE